MSVVKRHIESLWPAAQRRIVVSVNRSMDATDDAARCTACPYRIEHKPITLTRCPRCGSLLEHLHD